MKTSTKLTIAAAAMTGLLAGAAAARSSAATVPASTSADKAPVAKKSLDNKAGAKAFSKAADDKGDKHDCKGKNDCKGKGGCKTGDNGCKGKNSCKGKGGCKTSSL